MIQTLQQQRAAEALKTVNDWKDRAGKRPELASKLKARANELPFMIHANGLGQAAAFFKSKGNKDGYDLVFAALQKWLLESRPTLNEKQDLMVGITKADLVTYRAAQAEALQYMEWVKKLASAYLHDPLDSPSQEVCS